MTILEELIDIAMNACEKGRASGQKHHSRGAALLTGDGRVFSGCDVSTHEGDIHGVAAERIAALAAVSDGAGKFECVVIATDTLVSYPIPDGTLTALNCTVDIVRDRPPLQMTS
jgi:cytidine deaminase